MSFLGAPYPIVQTTHGYLYTQSDLDQIKSDLLILLLTNPGERINLPLYGTPLRTLVFEPNDAILAATAKQMIIDAINTWEPRITVDSINVSTTVNPDVLNSDDNLSEVNNILYINISFLDPQNMQEIDDLTLELPLGSQ